MRRLSRAWLSACRLASAWRAPILFLALLPLLCSCSRSLPPLTEAPDQLLTAFDVSDPRASVQLVRGFWQLEDGAWRWTTSKFAVVLRPPEHAKTAGARLELKLSVPQVILDQAGPVNLHATVNGLALPNESYTQPGEHTYSREVPAAALTADAVLVEFQTAKAVPPVPGGEDRELALVATHIGLLPK